ncbi:MAG: RNA polymerase sigma factor [Bacteroidota bacterium]
MRNVLRSGRDKTNTEPLSLEQLYDAHAPALLSLCYRYVGNMADAEDVLHDGFIKIIKNRATFRAMTVGTFEGWMKRIMVNTALNYIRDHAKEKRWVDLDPLYERIGNEEEEATFMDGLVGKIKQEVIMEMICELPPGYRTVFNMYVFESYSHKEIATEMNVSESTSKTQLLKARALLRKRIHEFLKNQDEKYGQKEFSR